MNSELPIYAVFLFFLHNKILIVTTSLGFNVQFSISLSVLCTHAYSSANSLPRLSFPFSPLLQLHLAFPVWHHSKYLFEIQTD